MEIDTGASLSVISESTYKKTWMEFKHKLRTYTGEIIPVKVTREVLVKHNGQNKVFPLVITEGEGPSLMGRNWLGQLRINWKGVFRIQDKDTLVAVLDRHQEVFKNELGTITCAKACLHINPQVPPIFHSPRPVPFAIRQKVVDELERLEKEGII